MLCALGGDPGPWARFTSPDPSLMKWKMADKSFTKGIDKGCDAGALFHKIPGATAGACPQGPSLCPHLLAHAAFVSARFRQLKAAYPHSP